MTESIVVAERPTHGEPRPYHFPKFDQTRLSNGLGLITIDLPGRALVTASLVLPSGAADEPEELGGVTSLMARAMTEGTAKRDAIELTEASERLGASLHAEAGWDGLSISVEDAREQMDAYFSRFGGIRDYLRRSVDRARMEGYTETLLGRRRYLPDLDSDNRQRREMAERMALNAPIQGSAADIIKVAMLNVDQALRDAGLASRMLLQVHDELVFEMALGEEHALEDLVRHQMGSAAELTVPLDVSVGTGRSWHEAAH